MQFGQVSLHLALILPVKAFYHHTVIKSILRRHKFDNLSFQESRNSKRWDTMNIPQGEWNCQEVTVVSQWQE